MNDDILILASDGVFDNLTPFKIAEIIEEKHEESVQVWAESITEAAFKLGGDREYISPYAKRAKAAGEAY